MFGGKFLFGSNNSTMLGPEFLLLEDIVLVIPNSRLGLLGFLKLENPRLGVPGNAALKDQVLALQWVQKNVAIFGGDPNNVTLAGHSSGAIAAHYHLFSESSKGLFHKAILLSGTILWDYNEKNEFDYKTFSDVLKIKVTNEEEFLQHLQKLPPECIVDAQEKYLNVSILKNILYTSLIL